jgi:hypothetical protein
VIFFSLQLLTDLNSAFVAFGVAPSRCIARQYTSDVCSAIDRFTSAEHINSQCQQMAEKLGGARLLWEFGTNPSRKTLTHWLISCLI